MLVTAKLAATRWLPAVQQVMEVNGRFRRKRRTGPDPAVGRLWQVKLISPVGDAPGFASGDHHRQEMFS